MTGAAGAGVAVATEEPISQVVAIATAAGAAIRELLVRFLADQEKRALRS